MRVLFFSGNREQLPDPVIPLGVTWVASALPDRHEKAVVDLCFEDDPLAVVKERIAAFEPDVVALGIRNIQTADYSGTHEPIAYYRQLVDELRQCTDVPVVVGGSGFSVMPESLMRALEPDYGIAGEAELAFPALLDALERRTGFGGIGGLHRFDQGELVSNPRSATFLDMDALPMPDRSLVDPRHYDRHAIEGVQTKRGCPLRCEYCTYPIVEGRTGRVRSPAAVVDEIEALAGGPRTVHHFFIVDSVFNLPIRHAKAVCREMISRGVDLPWTCYANPLGFDPELAELMAGAGCAGMEVGADSGSDRLLQTLRKGFTTDQIRRLSALAREFAIPDCHTFLLGTPGESIDDVMRTLDFIVDLDPFGAILMAWVDDEEALDPERARERQALRERVLQVLDDHKSEFPWWSIPSLGYNYDPRLFAMLRKRGLRGPLWQHLRKLMSGDRRDRRAGHGA